MIKAEDISVGSYIVCKLPFYKGNHIIYEKVILKVTETAITYSSTYESSKGTFTIHGTVLVCLGKCTRTKALLTPEAFFYTKLNLVERIIELDEIVRKYFVEIL